MKKILKSDLANWLVAENNDCGKDTYFSNDPRSALTVEDAKKKFMKEYTKKGLIDLIYDHSKEGQEFLEGQAENL